MFLNTKVLPLLWSQHSSFYNEHNNPSRKSFLLLLLYFPPFALFIKCVAFTFQSSFEVLTGLLPVWACHVVPPNIFFFLSFFPPSECPVSSFIHMKSYSIVFYHTSVYVLFKYIDTFYANIKYILDKYTRSHQCACPSNLSP